jgi:trehalose/maltose transport system substrate-binding protein
MNSSKKMSCFRGRDLSAVTFRHLSIACILLFILFALSCHSGDRGASAITLTVIDQGWLGSGPRLGPELEEFTRQTGIRVQVVPAPEAAVEQLAAWRELLESREEVPDVYAIDIIWPRILADSLIDLKSYVPEEDIAAHFPELIADYTVDGKLVALPYNMSEGLLFYRTDLLAKYGYSAPPRTWEELEAMARRIQAGERANGNKDFWGFVWEGAPSEALTCNALEWQVSEGGGTILDEHGKVTINNPNTISAWSMAARWVGSISPPGVTAYKEWDAFNMWQAGNTVFMRNWTNAYVAARAEDSPTREHFDVAPLPRGRAGFAATLGGNGYGVSRYSHHPREAAMLVRFLASPEEQARRCRKSAEPPTVPALYQNADVLGANPYVSRLLQLREGVALRPSGPAGKMYPEVSRAYFMAVHAVLTKERSAAQAASDLQKQLVRMLKSPAIADANSHRSEGPMTSRR